METPLQMARRMAAQMVSSARRYLLGVPVGPKRSEEPSSGAVATAAPAPAALREAAIRAAGLRETDDEHSQVQRFDGAIVLRGVPAEHVARLEAAGFVCVRGPAGRMVWEEP